MATVRLRRSEVRDDLLPPVCMRCGADATVSPAKIFSWHPPWVTVLILAGLLPWAIVAMVLTKRMTVRTPLCDQHRNHWSFRLAFIWGGLGAVVVLGVLAFALLIAAEDHRGGAAEVLPAILCPGVGLLGLAWLIAAAIIQHVGIRPTEITDRSITLTNVSLGFLDALDDERDERDERDEDEDDRPRRRSRRREDDEDWEPDDRVRR